MMPSAIFSLIPTLMLLTYLQISNATLDTNVLLQLEKSFLQCLSDHSLSSPTPISSTICTPSNASYSSILNSYIRNLRFSNPSTPKPFLILTPSHISHVQASVLCSKSHRFRLRIRSGGHDYDGLSYTAAAPFVLLDTSRLRDVAVDAAARRAAVQSGATLGELYYRIAEESRALGFPAGVCPTLGVGGHLSGGGYGNLMRAYGLTVDNVVDSEVVDAEGRVLDRRSMGEELFWAIRGGGGASFGVIVSWTIRLVPVPETVTAFKIERFLEEAATGIVHKWQLVAPKIDRNLFIRVVLLPATRKKKKTIKAKFVGLFLGNKVELLDLVNEQFPELGLRTEDCIEMGWIESVLFWANYGNGTSARVLLDRMPGSTKFEKKKSDYVQEPISEMDLERLWGKMMELERPALTLNPYGGTMSEISEDETPFPHRAGNLYKIQYSVTWKDAEASELSLGRIRSLYEFMTPFVSKSPRSAYLNYRDVDLGTNGDDGNDASFSEAKVWGTKYFKGNFERLGRVKGVVDPGNFFKYEQSIPPLSSNAHLDSGLSRVEMAWMFHAALALAGCNALARLGTEPVAGL